MKCSNCSDSALYTIKTPIANTVHYCEKHLPQYLQFNAHKGLYPVDAPAAPKKKKAAAVEPAPVEEPVISADSE